jgi:hypothetical protein
VRTVGEGAEDGGAAGAVVLVDVVDGARSGAAPGAGAAVGGIHRHGGGASDLRREGGREEMTDRDAVGKRATIVHQDERVLPAG